MRFVFAIVLMALITGGLSAQTETPTPLLTVPQSEHVFITMVADGTMTRFDYVATSGDVLIGTLILLIIISLWGFFFVGVIVLWRMR